MKSLTITNITDHPDKPHKDSLGHIVEIYNIPLTPGMTISLPTDLLNEKINHLVNADYIVIGEWPEYYKDFRNPIQKTQQKLIEETQSIINLLEKPKVEVEESTKKSKKKEK